jgi:hypothetical protein
MRISVLTGLAGATAALIVAASAPLAYAGPPVTTTTVEKNVVTTFVDVGPGCGEGDLYEITTTSRSFVEHVTEFDDGRVHATFTDTGTFEATPVAAGMPATGRYTIWGGFNANNSTVNGTFTFNISGTFADGTRFSEHLVEHFNVTPDGTEFFFSRCHNTL